MYPRRAFARPQPCLRRRLRPHPGSPAAVPILPSNNFPCRTHVRVSDADASEGHRDEDRSARLLPAVIANLQRHPGRRQRVRRLTPTRLLEEAGITTHQPFRSGGPGHPQRSQRAPGAPLRPPCGLPRDRLGRLVGRSRCLGSYPFEILRSNRPTSA